MKMADKVSHLRRTSCAVGTVEKLPLRLLNQWRVTPDTYQKDNGLGEQISGRRSAAVDAHNFGDDLPAFFNQNGIAFTEVEFAIWSAL